MKKIQYKVGNTELLGELQSGAIVLNAYLVARNGGIDGLIYFPKKVYWSLTDKNGKVETGTDRGCGCISFGEFDGDYWIRNSDDYINFDEDKTNPFERKINYGARKNTRRNTSSLLLRKLHSSRNRKHKKGRTKR